MGFHCHLHVPAPLRDMFIRGWSLKTEREREREAGRGNMHIGKGRGVLAFQRDKGGRRLCFFSVLGVVEVLLYSPLSFSPSSSSSFFLSLPSNLFSAGRRLLFLACGAQACEKGSEKERELDRLLEDICVRNSPSLFDIGRKPNCPTQ